MIYWNAAHLLREREVVMEIGADLPSCIIDLANFLVRVA